MLTSFIYAKFGNANKKGNLSIKGMVVNRAFEISYSAHTLVFPSLYSLYSLYFILQPE